MKTFSMKYKEFLEKKHGKGIKFLSDTAIIKLLEDWDKEKQEEATHFNNNITEKRISHFGFHKPHVDNNY